MMKTHNFISVLFLLLLAGCMGRIDFDDRGLNSTPIFPPEPEIVCEPPYIRHGDECCLDLNNNNICDHDEIEEHIPPPEESGLGISIERHKGSPDAPVLMVMWSDFRCPFCQRFWRDTLPAIKKEYIETGKVYFAYKDFPVVGGEAEANAGWCAYEQGMFWEFHNILFENSQRGNKENFEIWAGELGMDRDEFMECYNSERNTQRVASDAREGRDFGVTGTPGFYINGELVTGAQPLENFRSVIESKLNE